MQFTVINSKPTFTRVKNAFMESMFPGLKIVDRKKWKDGEAYLIECTLSVAMWFAKSLTDDETNVDGPNGFNSSNA